MEALERTILGLLHDVAPRAYRQYTEKYGEPPPEHPFDDIDSENLADVPAPRLREFLAWKAEHTPRATY